MNNKFQTKCRYYDKGFCRNRENCLYYHPTDDCQNNCKNKKCSLRHRNVCRYKTHCYFNINGKCEYLHLETEVLEEAMAVNDNDNLEAHKVILSAAGPNFKDKYETEKNKSDRLEDLNKQYVSEIEKLQNEIKQLKNKIDRKSEEIDIVKEEKKKDIEQLKKEIEGQNKEINKQKEKRKKDVKNKEQDKTQLDLVSDKMLKIMDNRENSESYFNFQGVESMEIPDMPDIFNCDKCGYTSCIDSSYKNHKCKEHKRTKRK